MRNKIEDIITKFDKGNIINKNELKKKYRSNIILLLVTIFFILLMITPVNSTVIGELDTKRGEYMIDCLGLNNEIFIYKDEVGKPVLSYRRSCDYTKRIKKDIIETAQYVELRNLETNNDFLYYKEVLTKIDETKADIKKTEFENKICLEVKIRKYADISIGGLITPQTKNVYQCILKESIQTDKVEILINDKLISQETFNKQDRVTISIKDFSLINPDLANVVNVEFRNSAKNSMKIQMIDSNIQCARKTFILGDKFVMACNVSDPKNMLNYFIQVKTARGEILYKDLTKPIIPKTPSNVNYWYILIGAGIVAVIYFNGRVVGSDKKALQQLGEEDSKENDKR